MCVVTGAGRDLGQAIAGAVASEGAEVVLHYNRSKGGAAKLSRRIHRGGGKAHLLSADLRSESSCRWLIRTSARLLGRIDILINSAGLFERTDVSSLTERQFDRLLALNLKAPVFCAIEAAKVMTRRGGVGGRCVGARSGGGRIVNISSLGAFQAWPAYLAYCASKAALVSATRSLARATAPFVMVNSVAPGLIDLPEGMSESERDRLVSAIPAGRIGTYDDVIDAVLYFCTAEYVTGQVLLVDGGASLR